jgi:CRP/FNR family transcriptional regulator, anaerobic regulatory protein
VLAPAARYDSELLPTHPCSGCAVRRLAVCGVLDCDKLAALRRLGNHSRLSPGQPLFHEGDDADRVYTVTRGSLKLYKLLPDGRRQITGFMHAGDFVGTSFDNEYAFTAEALEHTQLCSYPGKRFDEFTQTNPELERELYRLAAHEAAAAQQQFVLLGRKTAAERVASFFVGLAQRTEKRKGLASSTICLPMSRSDIADYLGLTKETVSRVISMMKSQRLIRSDKAASVEILDRQGLEELAAGDRDSPGRVLESPVGL